jgi:hypothetical protein
MSIMNRDSTGATVSGACRVDFRRGSSNPQERAETPVQEGFRVVGATGIEPMTHAV